jgi:Ca2+:H+ antiporter
MKEPTPKPPKYTDRIRSWVNTKANGGKHQSPKRSDPNLLPISNPQTHSHLSSNSQDGATSTAPSGLTSLDGVTIAQPTSNAGTEDGSKEPSPGNTSKAAESGAVVGGRGDRDGKVKKNSLVARFWRSVKLVLFHSKVNLLLVFVPVGIAVHLVHGLSPGVVFAMNAIAIIPLAGLLSFATETVARRLGDSLGALLNVTFGNAVELIIL